MKPMRLSIAREVAAEGIALHAGTPVRMRLLPAPAGTGIVFRRLDLGGAEVPARYDLVSDARLGSTLTSGTARVGVVEHLMAAVAGAGLSDLIVAIDGPEPPIFDGSAANFLNLIETAGVRAQSGPRPVLEIVRPVSATKAEASARLEPAGAFSLGFTLEYPEPVVGRQVYDFAFSPAGFARDIAPARTFGFVRELDALHAAGLGRGASLENTLALTETAVMNQGGLRFADEFVRHKILDAVGDLALAGAPILGRFVGVRSGHALNNALLRALFADPGSYRWVDRG